MSKINRIMAEWIVKTETIFVQRVMFLSFLPHSRRMQRWNEVPLHSGNRERTPPPPNLATTHTLLFARGWKKNLLS